MTKVTYLNQSSNPAMTENDKIFMRRAIELARHGLGNVSPNPMVGAVVVSDGKIIGEGYHRRWGEAHAEVNAINSVSDKAQLANSTIYITLEPCSHYGKTPPCAKLLIDSGIRNVVIGCLDPFKEVSGRGVSMLRNAGIKVTSGVLEEECLQLNKAFITAHTLQRPYITLKWAQSFDGFIDKKREPSDKPATFSNTITSTLTHRLRSLNDAILVGSGTVIYDNPSLNVRLWPGQSPTRIALDNRQRIPPTSKINDPAIAPSLIIHPESHKLDTTLHNLYNQGITSLLVEGGASLLQSFIQQKIWDLARVETSPLLLHDGVKSPMLNAKHFHSLKIGENTIDYYIPD